jgi:hypothetical protein
MKKEYSSHYIFGVQPDRTINAYSVSGGKINLKKTVTIWQLRRIFKSFDTYLDLSLRRTYAKKSLNPDIAFIYSVFDRLEKQTSVSRLDLTRATLLIITFSPAYYLKKMQDFSDVFLPLTTPQYRTLIKSVNFNILFRDELIFHTCYPDMYAWIPSISKTPKKAIVIFLTRNNHLNMPRPIAHMILARFGVALIYIGNRPNMKPHEYLVGHNLEETAKVISDITSKLGLTELYGLGASYGGYKACRLAASLGFKRVLNFSGAISESEEVIKNQKLNMAPHYPHDQILSVLSKSDPVDQKILQRYEEEQFSTKRDFLESSSHGTFTSSFIEGRINRQFAWLLAD